ncbi:MAG: 2-amino-4-hydroxy-6-hydroxymethyldihydropteridine diphosphokinase, partial [Myxococcales bacterium]|nr:2-amino-4-hydroxy-6-hydroxymethyldihydropteridine diphosphokinase [Myxococcales bacterium]
RTGYALVREAVGGLMDEAPEPVLEAVVAGLAAGREPAWIDAHGLRAWRSGDFIHVDLHLGVPRYLDADALHEIDERIARIVASAVASPNETIVHFDPCRPRQCPSCRVRDCPIREAAFVRAAPFTRESVTRRDEVLETGEPLPAGAPAPASGALAFVSLGSNLGDRAAHLRDAARSLAATPGVTVLARSRVYETDPVGPPPQGPYLNAVLKLRTTLTPAELLSRLLAVEQEHGRERGAERNLARSLDLDLLDYDGRVVASEREPALELPHPRLHERGFVLEPLAELAGDRRHPGLDVPYATLAARVRDPAAVRLHDGRKGGSPWPSSP